MHTRPEALFPEGQNILGKLDLVSRKVALNILEVTLTIKAISNLMFKIRRIT